MSRQQLLKIVEEYGLVETLLMPPNKPYSFVKYGTTEEAKKAFDALNGKEVTLEDFSQNIVLYINFVEKGIFFLLSCIAIFLHTASLCFYFLGVNIAKSTLVFASRHRQRKPESKIQGIKQAFLLVFPDRIL